MDEDQKRRWDARVALVGPVLTVLTIFVGVIQFNRDANNRLAMQTRSAQLQDDLQFQRKLWSDGAQDCREITQLAAGIAAEFDFGSQPEPMMRDWIKKYWSVSLVLQPNDPLDDAVERAIIEFRTDLEDLRTGDFDRTEIANRLKFNSHSLGEACGAKMRAGSSKILSKAQTAAKP